MPEKIPDACPKCGRPLYEFIPRFVYYEDTRQAIFNKMFVPDEIHVHCSCGYTVKLR